MYVLPVPRNFGSQGARMPFPVMRGPGGRVQGGRYPQQMQFRPQMGQMGQFPGQMRSSMGARGPMYGQQSQVRILVYNYSFLVNAFFLMRKQISNEKQTNRISQE